MGKIIDQITALNKIIQNNKRELTRLQKENVALRQQIESYYKNVEMASAMGAQLSGFIKERKNDFSAASVAMHTLLHVLPGRVYWKDRYGIYLGASESLEKIVGQKVVGKTIYDLLPEEMADAVTEADERIMQRNAAEVLEEQGLDDAGNIAYYLTHKVPLHDKQGKVIGLLGLSFDITQRKQYADNLQEVNRKLLALDKAREDFINSMSHDMNTPLNGIIGSATYLRDDAAIEGDNKKLVDAIYASAWRLHKFFNEVMEAVQAGNNIEIKPEILSVREILQEVVEFFMPQLQHKKLKLILRVADTVPELLMADRRRLHRILLNLLSNAVKFNHAGHITISVIVTRKADKNSIKFSIKDTGIGIAKDKQDLIFEKFSRITPSFQTNDLSPGLGLWIAQKFASDLGSHIHLKSQENLGSEFYFVLPLN